MGKKVRDLARRIVERRSARGGFDEMLVKKGNLCG